MNWRLILSPVLLAAPIVTGDTIAAAQRFGSDLDRMSERTGEPDVNPNMTAIRGPGDYRFSFVYDRKGREYSVHVPRKYRGEPMPMLIALHEEDSTPVDDWEYGLILDAREESFIVVSPKGYRGAWNAGRCCGRAQNHNIDDVGFIREVISRVGRQIRIDSKRIFATGFSNGAMMSWRLACEAPEIRAIAPVAGTDNTTNCSPSHPVGVIQFHATNDQDVPFDGGKGRRSIGALEFTSVPASQAKWVNINQADPKPSRVLTVPGAHCDIHRAIAGSAPVELCVIDEGDHDWPGSTRPIQATDLMLNFFSSL